MNYKIKQRKGQYEFIPWFKAKDGFDPSDYEVVYEGELYSPEMPNALEDVYYTFNQEIPADFKGHSLSVGDLVEVDGVDYYCDFIGWADTKAE